ncbi:MAG TPA: type II toxin-antitoxin system PemK/MazF family toxin [Chitinophagaceae bacterium]|nr:type II toxin-antitoxin system PemK/MazF family toxin [Chitinophagaceae bacterium]
MPAYRFGDILILNFPFAEGNSSKRRPVMVILDTEDGDLLISKITSKKYSSLFDQEIIEWQCANLLTYSVVRVHKIQTVSSNLIFCKIGNLHPVERKAIRHKLVKLIMKI